MPDVFLQSYDPIAGSILASALAASLPLLVIAVLLAGVRVAAWRAAIAGAAAAFLLAWGVWGLPLDLAVSAATHGMAFGLWPIGWIVLNAVFFYNLSVASGDFDVIRRSLSRLTADRRVQVLLVAFGFGGLIEAVAGFGAPVAITASMLAGLGFERLTAAVLALIANTAPVAFASMGIPVTTLGGLVAPLLGRDVQETTLALSATIGRQLSLFSILVPAYLVVLLAGWRGLVGVWPAVLAAGGSFALAQVLVSNFVGPELTGISAALCSMAALALLLRVWTPPDRWTSASGQWSVVSGQSVQPEQVRDSNSRMLRAYATYGVLVLVVLIGHAGNIGIVRAAGPPLDVTTLLRCGQRDNVACPDPWVGSRVSTAPQGFRFPVWDFQWPGSYRVHEGEVHPRIRRVPPVAADVTPYPMPFRFDALASAGTLVLLAALVAFAWMARHGMPVRTFVATWGRTLRQLRLTVLTITCILSISTVMNYSGMTSSMALALSRTGWLFPFFSAVLGMLGVFLTGSDTASNTLFGPLQATTARVTGLDPLLTASTNSSGGVMGKMISPQNLAVGAAGVGAVGQEGAILRRVVVHSLLLTALVGVLAMLQAYVVPWTVGW